MTAELILSVISAFLLLFTMGTVALYYKRIKRARQEYNEARNVVGDIVISFDRQVDAQEERLNSLALKVGTISSKTDRAVEMGEGKAKKLVDLGSKLEAVSGTVKGLSERVQDLDKKLSDVILTQEKMTQRITEVERAKQEVVMPEPMVETAIPIKREKALAPLTETELLVLNLLSTEGQKTAPEIKERVKLTREHTARLMKKLYEGGYLERDSKKMPYAYRIKEEMRKILGMTEQSG